MRRLVVMIPSAFLMVALVWIWSLSSAHAAQKADNSPRSVYGHVLNRDSQPLAKAVVYLKNTKTLAIRSYITEQDGAFRFGAVAANVDYEIYADCQGGHSEIKTLSAFDDRKQAEFTLKIRSLR
ncbi:MAG TPA: carboxypeptidase-like regulatory domain-containing protein [Terriglobales bacterium]